MFKTLHTIFLGRASRAEQALETRHAAVIIEQKIREAEAAHMNAKRGLARLLARCQSEESSLGYVEARVSDLEERTKAALTAGKTELARDAAGLLADLENERQVRRDSLAKSRDKADRIRLAIEKTQRQLIDLRQGLITARAIEAERNAMGGLAQDISASSAIREGEAVLARLIGSADPVAEMDALESLEADLSGDSVMDRLAAEGFGKPVKVRAEDILARFTAESSETATS